MGNVTAGGANAAADCWQGVFARGRWFGGLPVEAWLPTRLTDLAGMLAAASGSSVPVTLGVSRSRLATMVGLSRRSLSTLLARLRARGLVEVGFRAIRVLEPA